MEIIVKNVKYMEGRMVIDDETNEIIENTFPWAKKSISKSDPLNSVRRCTREDQKRCPLAKALDDWHRRLLICLDNNDEGIDELYEELDILSEKFDKCPGAQSHE